MRRLLKALLLIPLLLIVYIVVINLLPDEELSAGAREWLTPEPMTVAAEQNSYYLLWGLDAPAGVDMREYGEATVAKIIQLNRKAEDAQNLSDYEPDDLEGEGRLEVTGIEGLCDPAKTYCLDEYRQGANSLMAAGHNTLLLQRYRDLSSAAHYYNVIPHDIYKPLPIPRISPLNTAHRLRMVSIAASYVEGNKRVALDELAADLRFCRMLLAEADTLVMRMVANNMVSRDLHTYSQLLESEQPHGDLIRAVEEINELVRVERDFETVMQGELQFAYQTFNSALAGGEDDNVAGRIVRFALPLNKRRMINRAQDQYRKIVALESLPPSSVIYESERIIRESMPESWDYLRDPLTSVIIAISAPDYPNYLLRHYDLNALIRLLKLKALIKKAGVTTDRIDAFITASPYASAYPEEMVPVRWDAGAQALTFDSALGERVSKRAQLFFRGE